MLTITQFEARKHKKMSIAHAAQSVAFDRALEAGVDMITHVPMDKAIEKTTCDAMVAKAVVAIPTLTMMRGVVINIKRPGVDFANSISSVTKMYASGVPILAGTDSNAQPGSPAPVKHGESLHDELELLVSAGLSNLYALRAATSLHAKYFGLHDRGVIEPGRRADLVLISGDPIEDIRATRQVQKVWCAGVEVRRL